MSAWPVKPFPKFTKRERADLTVRVKDNLRDEMEKIRNLMIDTGDGQKIPLNYVAEIRSAIVRTPSAARM